MGTNVYALKEDPRKLPNWKKIEEAVSNRDPWSLEEEVERLDESLEENKVHLGKRSGGWKFTFDFQYWKYYDHTEESINKFLKNSFGIIDEYGNTYTVEEFWNEFALFNPFGTDNKKYEEEHGTPTSKDMAIRNDFFMSNHSPAGKIPEDLPYFFSNHSDFS